MSGRLRTLLGAAAAGLLPHDLGSLLLTRNHPPAVMRARAELISARLRQIAGLFSVLTVAWIAVDAYSMPWPYWGEIMVGRIVTALAFLALALCPSGRWPRNSAALQVGVLVAIPLLFFCYTNSVLAGTGRDGSLAISTAYYYLPFIIAAGMSVFPLTALEAAVPAGLAIGAMALAIATWPELLGGQSGAATLWRLAVIAGIAVMAGMSQLRFLLRLTEQATRDGLTNLLVRGTGEEILENQFAYAQRHDLPFAVLFIDIDHFKKVNDEFGHEAGDTALRAVASQIARAFRHQDVLIRWGGEEFVIGLPGANLVNAEIAVLRLAKLGIGLKPDYRPITASIGVAERQADKIDSLAAMVERADARMYEAKGAGRNRYVFQAGPKPWITPPQETASAA